MSKRNLIIIGLFIIVALLLIISNKKEKEENGIKHNYILKNLNIHKIKAISIKNFTIRKNNDKWTINNIECNKYRIEYLINYLKETDFENVISDKKENYQAFKVDNKKALKIKIITDNKVYNLWIGKSTPDGNGCYVRLDDGKVYLLTKNLLFEFDKNKKYFYLEKKQDNKTKDS